MESAIIGGGFLESAKGRKFFVEKNCPEKRLPQRRKEGSIQTGL